MSEVWIQLLFRDVNLQCTWDETVIEIQLKPVLKTFRAHLIRSLNKVRNELGAT